MPASLRELRQRRKSVAATQKITRAMELVAASKMKKAQQTALANRPYTQLMADMLAALSARVDDSTHPFLSAREVKTRGVLLLTTNMGLCGALNANLFKLTAEIKTPVKYAVVGRKGAQFLARSGRSLMAEFSVNDRVPFSEVKQATEFMVRKYLEGEIDTVEVVALDIGT